MTKKTEGSVVKTKAPKAQKTTTEVTPEIVNIKQTIPPKKTEKKEADDATQIVRHSGDMTSLETLQSSIKRDLMIAGRLDKASAMVGVKIGLALNAAKDMLKHGAYEPWVGFQFGSDFGSRKAQYFSKLAKVFVSESKTSLALPAPRETGNWLIQHDEGSDLATAVSTFVGDLSLAELLDKHKIKAVKKTGGFRPSETMLNRYLQDHNELLGIPFDAWNKEQRDAFRKWADENNDGNSAEARAMAAEGAWHIIRKSLQEHGIDRKSWPLLTRDTLQESYDMLTSVAKLLGKAIKEMA